MENKLATMNLRYSLRKGRKRTVSKISFLLSDKVSLTAITVMASFLLITLINHFGQENR